MIVVTLLASSAIVSAQPPKPAMGQSGPGKGSGESLPRSVQGFSVVLVLGDLQGGTTADNVPPAARKALADMKDFLPYKSYKLLDSGWILGSNSVSQRMRGVEDQEYELNLSAYATAGADAKTLHIAFRLADASGFIVRPTGSTNDKETAARAGMEDARRQDIEKQMAVLEMEQKRARDAEGGKGNSRLQEELSTKIAELRNAGSLQLRRNAGRIIDTSFSMEVGETVVVGTSRLRGGDKALIALLTAVPRRP
jgi:hypothetical protein